MMSFLSINFIKLDINTEIKNHINCIDIIVFLSSILFAFFFFFLPIRTKEEKITELSKKNKTLNIKVYYLSNEVNQLTKKIRKLDRQQNSRSDRKQNSRSIRVCIKNKFCK